MPTVELQTAYRWHCDKCSAENFAVPEKAELIDDEREEAYRKYHDVEEWEELPEGWSDFDLVWLPKLVTCKDCGEQFDAINETRA